MVSSGPGPPNKARARDHPAPDAWLRGPGAEDITMTADGLRKELAGLEIEALHETEREVVEGAYHRGTAAVVQMLAWKR